MKLFISIILTVIGAIYIGCFCKTIVILLDLGSGKSKIVVSIAGIKLTELRENSISRFLASRGIKYPEAWIEVHSYRGGFIKLSRNDGSSSFDTLIPRVNRWLDKKLNDDKLSEQEIKTIVLPVIVKFIESLINDNDIGIKEVHDLILDERLKKIDKVVEVEKSNTNNIP
jgi:hypothetical protein